MAGTSFTARLLKDGKITIPIENRIAMCLKEGDMVSIEIKGTFTPKPKEAKNAP